MRLLHAKTLEFQVFHDNEIPRYLILSHTWGMEEISYQEMRFLQQHHALPDSLKSDTTVMAALEAAAGLKIFAMNSKSIQARAGYRKIQKAAKLAREKGLKYIWIDTCCIDKSSSAELQEAINSMYRWYQQSCFCMVHLEDAGPVRNPGSDLRRHYDIATILRTSRWITRGWTLQELIAPKALAFYDQNFALIGSKSMFCPTIAEVTGIPLSVLRTGDLSQASVAQKMSWAANRKTTRAEDRAYSLMGLFGIHMPMLYGEGDNAFRRLQEEIMRRTPDDSIFAWRAPDGSLSRYCGLLAMSPDDFEGSQGIEQGRGQFATSNLGLRIEARLCPLLDDIPGEMWDDSIFALPLGAIEKGRIIALLIRRLGASHYTRVAANTFSHRLNDNGKPEAIYIEHTPKIPKIFRSRAMHCFQFKFDSTVYRIRSAQPKQLWDPIHSDLSINPEFCTNNGSDNNGYPGAPVFYGTVRLYYQNRNFPLACSINFGHNLVTGRVWLKLLGSASTPIEPNWRSVCQEPESYDELLCPEPLVQVLNISNSEAVRVTVHCGLHRGMISYIVHIVQQKYMLPTVLRT